MTGSVRSTFVYDGDCAFCTSCAEFIGRHVHVAAGPDPVDVIPWQFTDINALGLTVQQCEQAVQWVGADGRRAAGPEAIAELLRRGGPWWRPVGWLLGRRTVLELARPVYRWVARNRHRMPGGTAACALPVGAGGAGAGSRR
ncbi:MAG TPA: DCC1-like thiol-disulfide oxidoreductase family protein [Micromonosporaceae bacterium]|jgi:predicted DCC family thiol-disulfide oxidoreductase YuxK|nr:DCC1-like thiol-disulfide oxidoreductase family protein [Micromonosporaceae bacterium]